MARKGKARHLKKISMPKVWKVPKKGKGIWITKPSPGKHSKNYSIPLGILIRDVLKIADNVKSVKKILGEGMILVDGRVAKDAKIAIGLMDLISIPKAGKHYRLLVIKGTLKPVEITQEEAKIKYCKVINKTVIEKNKIQLNLHDGRNYLLEKEEDVFKTGDTIKLLVPENKLAGFIKLEKNGFCYIYKGKHAGKIAELQEIMERAGSKESDARLKTQSGEEIITLKNYLFAVDKNFKIQ